MSNIFLSIYNYFEQRKTIFYLFLIAVLGSCALVISQLKLEEDISQLMPIGEEFEEYNDFFQNSEFADRLVLHLYNKDTINLEESAEPLQAYCDSLVLDIEANLDSSQIKNLLYKVDESQFLSLYDLILTHLPVFLTEKDYENLEEQTDTAKIQDKINGVYKALMSPASFVIKKAVMQDPLGMAGEALRNLQAFQIDDNFELDNGYILTKDKQHLLLFLTTANSSRETKENSKLIDELDEIIAALDSEFDGKIQCEYFGAAAVAVGNANRMKLDIMLTVNIALAVLFCLLTFFYRRKRAFFLIILPTLFGAAISLALLVLIKEKVSLISIGIGSVLLGITIDYSLHLLTHFRNHRDARKVIKDVSLPILMSSLTTAGAFMCLMFVRSQALHDLGMFAAFSVFSSAIFALIILPHLAGFQKEKKELKPTFIDRWGHFNFHQKKWIPISIALISLAFWFKGSKAHFEENLNAINYLSDKLKQAEQNLNRISSASMRGVYVLAKGAELSEVLQKTESIIPTLDSLKQQAVVAEYTPVSNILMSENIQEKRIARWNTFWTEDRKEAVKQKVAEASAVHKFKPTAFAKFYRLLDKEYVAQPLSTFDPFKDLFLRDYISEKENEVSLLTLLRLEQENKKPVYDRFSDIKEVTILDKELLSMKFVEVLRADFDRFIFISMLFVFLLLWLSYGRIELALITFLPISLSWLWVLGLMQFFGLSFNIVNIIIATFIFGLGIDYSIFIMRGLLQEYQYGERNLSSYRTAIYLSAITTLTGIGVLIFAQHPALKSIAALSIIGILSVLIIAMTLEPLLFEFLAYKKKREPKEKREYPLTLAAILITFWSYFLLSIGCILVSILGLVLKILFFIPIETQKLILHYAIWGLSKIYIRCNFPFHETRINLHNEDFSKPAIIVSNHQALIDTTIMFCLAPKTIILTKDWVAKFPLFRYVIKFADFLSVDDGFEEILPKLKDRVANGYSIAIFPEGSRAPDDGVKRFHKGAFYLAETMNMEIVPIYLHGTGRFLRKGSFWGAMNWITIKIGKRIKPGDPEFEGNYSQRTKLISKHFKQNYAVLRQERETTNYFRSKVIENYTYKGPLLEWYMRVKTRLDGNYHLFNDLVPRKAVVTDIGCGYGFMSYMLAFCSNERNVLGLDYDAQKIQTAQNCPSKNDQINFEAADVTKHPLRPSDVFILADMLHYLPKGDQYNLLQRCVQNLNPGGKIIIRDGDADLKKRHKGTKLTELFSTKLGFNKTQNELSFLSGSELETWAKERGFKVERIDETKRTSNVIFVLEQRNP